MEPKVENKEGQEKTDLELTDTELDEVSGGDVLSAGGAP